MYPHYTNHNIYIIIFNTRARKTLERARKYFLNLYYAMQKGQQVFYFFYNIVKNKYTQRQVASQTPRAVYHHQQQNHSSSHTSVKIFTIHIYHPSSYPPPRPPPPPSERGVGRIFSPPGPVTSMARERPSSCSPSSNSTDWPSVNMRKPSPLISL